MRIDQVLLALILAAAALAQTGARLSPRFVSPDGSYTLLSDAAEPRLWIEDASGHRRLVIEATLQTMTIIWSPDSAAFIVDDYTGSNDEAAYVFQARTLERLDLRNLILAADTEAVRFTEPDIPGAPPLGPPNRKSPASSLAHATRWLDSSHVEVELSGHTGGIQVGRSIEPGDCFSMRYRISTSGTVEKISQRVVPISQKHGCDID
jgi:hypothetical protein